MSEVLAPGTPSVGAVCVLDTDTFNEIDDQFALAYLIGKAREGRVDLRAVTAAPFHNERSRGPEEGMELSLAEIERICAACGWKTRGRVFAGSRSWMGSGGAPVESDAAAEIVRLAHEVGELWVLAIGAPTNVSSALRLDPSIREKVRVVWLGGHALGHPDCWEFNLQQDLVATRVLLEGDVPLVLVPCLGVASHLRVDLRELEQDLPSNVAGGVLLESFREYVSERREPSRILWDVAVVAWATGCEAVRTHVTGRPSVLGDGGAGGLRWGASGAAARVSHMVWRDGVVRDMLGALGRLG